MNGAAHQAARSNDPAERFRRDGYLILDLDIPDFDATAEQITHLRYGSAQRIENAWRSNAAVRDLATLPQILDLLANLYGREAFPFQTLNFSRGTEQATHSDTVHFDSSPAGYMAGVWIALEDIDGSNGPLRYYPGSHRLPHLTLGDFGIRSLDGRDPTTLYRTVYEPGIARLVRDCGLTPVEAHLRKGQAMIWAANLLHGGAPIRSADRTRHSQVTHYYFAGCSYRTPLTGAARYPVDIRTGRNRGGDRDGKPIPVPLSQQIKSWGKTVLRSGTRHSM